MDFHKKQQPSAFDRAEQRIAEIKRSQESERATLEQAINEQREILNRIDNQVETDPVKILENVQKRREATENLEALEKAYERMTREQTDKVTAEETRDILTALEMETRAEMLELTRKGLELEEQIFTLSKECFAVRERFFEAVRKWREGVAPSIDPYYSMSRSQNVSSPLADRYKTLIAVYGNNLVFQEDNTVKQFKEAVKRLESTNPG